MPVAVSLARMWPWMPSCPSNAIATSAWTMSTGALLTYATLSARPPPIVPLGAYPAEVDAPGLSDAAVQTAVDRSGPDDRYALMM